MSVAPPISNATSTTSHAVAALESNRYLSRIAHHDLETKALLVDDWFAKVILVLFCRAWVGKRGWPAVAEAVSR